MADSASPILLQRIQSVGSNVNLWGGYINTDLQIIEQASKGYQTLAVTGDATISWANYTLGNVGSAALLKLTGSVTGTLTFPSYQNYLAVWNANSASVTIKCSGGTGVTLATGQRALLYCDGTDYYNAGPTLAPTSTQSTATNAYALWGAVETAIATASLPATAGTVLNSGGDTTAGYHASKHDVTASGDITAAFTTQNPAADEELLLTITGTPYWNTPRTVALADSPVAAIDRDIILVRSSTGAIEIDLPASGRVQIIDVDGSGLTNNITVDPPAGDSLMDGAADETMLLDLNFFSGAFYRRPSGTNWSVS